MIFIARRYSFLSASYLFISALAKKHCSDPLVKPFSLSLSNCSIARPNFQDVFSWGLSLTVGSPPFIQELCFTPSTVTNNTFLIGRDICSGKLENMTFDQCESRHGSTFDIVAAESSFHNLSLTEDELPEDPGWIEFNTAPTIIGTTDLNLVSNLVLPNMTVEVVTEGNNFTAAHLGLGNDSFLLHALVESKMIPSVSWGLNAGSQSVSNPRDGSLVLGGYDAAAIKGPFYNYSMGHSITVAGRICPIQIGIEQLHLLLDGRQEPIEMMSEGDGHSACIEPYDNLFRLSETALDKFKSVTAWSDNTTYDGNAIYVNEPGLAYPSQIGFNGSLRFFLSNGLTITIPNEELTHPLRGLNFEGEKILQTNITEVNVYSRALGAWVLPKAFLSQLYLAVDYQEQQFQLAEVFQYSVPPNLVPFTSAPTLCPSNSQLSSSSIAAIVVGIVVPLLIIGGLGYWIYRKRSTKRKHYELDTTQSHMTTTGSRELSDTITTPMQAGSPSPIPTGSATSHTQPGPSAPNRQSAIREMDSFGTMSELEAPNRRSVKLR